jgi:hypothetical protein
MDGREALICEERLHELPATDVLLSDTCVDAVGSIEGSVLEFHSALRVILLRSGHLVRVRQQQPPRNTSPLLPFNLAHGSLLFLV